MSYDQATRYRAPLSPNGAKNARQPRRKPRRFTSTGQLPWFTSTRQMQYSLALCVTPLPLSLFFPPRPRTHRRPPHAYAYSYAAAQDGKSSDLPRLWVAVSVRCKAPALPFLPPQAEEPCVLQALSLLRYYIKRLLCDILGASFASLANIPCVSYRVISGR